MPNVTKAKIAEREALASEGLKRCGTCQEVLPVECYGKYSRSTWDGLRGSCKSCRKAEHAASYEKSRDQVLQRQRAKYAASVGKEPGAGGYAAGESHWRWAGDTPSYLGAHKRVHRLRGGATGHACVDCAGPAAEWSYRGSADVELTEALTSGYATGSTVAYSPDPADYEPRCKRCHRAYDANREAIPA